jgi:hypothetical protein
LLTRACAAPRAACFRPAQKSFERYAALLCGALGVAAAAPAAGALPRALAAAAQADAALRAAAAGANAAAFTPALDAARAAVAAAAELSDAAERAAAAAPVCDVLSRLGGVACLHGAPLAVHVLLLRHAARAALPLPGSVSVDAAALLGDARAPLAAALSERDAAKDAPRDAELYQAALCGAPPATDAAGVSSRAVAAFLARGACARRAAALLRAAGAFDAAAALAARAADTTPAPSALLRCLPGGTRGGAGADLRCLSVELLCAASDDEFEAVRAAWRDSAAALAAGAGGADADADAGAGAAAAAAAGDDDLFFFDVPSAAGGGGTLQDDEDGEGEEEEDVSEADEAALDVWMATRPGTRPQKRRAGAAAADDSDSSEEEEP